LVFCLVSKRLVQIVCDETSTNDIELLALV
jgi:hypothetical protein